MFLWSLISRKFLKNVFETVDPGSIEKSVLETNFFFFFFIKKMVKNCLSCPGVTAGGAQNVFLCSRDYL